MVNDKTVAGVHTHVRTHTGIILNKKIRNKYKIDNKETCIRYRLNLLSIFALKIYLKD